MPEELVRKESERIARDLRWRDIPDESKRALRIHGAAEQAAIDRMLVEAAAAGDPRPVDPNIVASEVQRLKGQWGCRAAFDDGQLRQSVERGFRI